MHFTNLIQQLQTSRPLTVQVQKTKHGRVRLSLPVRQNCNAKSHALFDMATRQLMCEAEKDTSRKTAL